MSAGKKMRHQMGWEGGGGMGVGSGGREPERIQNKISFMSSRRLKIK